MKNSRLEDLKERVNSMNRNQDEAIELIRGMLFEIDDLRTFLGFLLKYIEAKNEGKDEEELNKKFEQYKDFFYTGGF
jgi:hypothetical protein